MHHHLHRFRRLGIPFVAVALLAGCGSSDDDATRATSTTATALEATTTSTGTPATTTGTPATTATTAGVTTSTKPPPPATTTTTAKKKPVPGVPPGPTDPDTIVGDQWYKDLVRPTAAKCSAMRETATGSTAGAALTDLYLAAAAACLGRWDEAKTAFATWSASQPDDPSPRACGRPFVVTFVRTLLDRHAANPSFKPEFVAAAPGKPCAEETTEP